MGAIVLLQFGAPLEGIFMPEDYIAAVDEGLIVIANSDQDDPSLKGYDRCDELFEGDIEESLLNMEFLGWDIDSVSNRIKHGIVPGTLFAFEVEIIGTYSSTPEGEDYDVEISFPHFWMARPSNHQACVEMECLIALEQYGECQGGTAEHYRREFIGYLECQEQLDWRLCPRCYHRACRQLEELWGEALTREIDPLYDLRLQAHYQLTSGWAELGHLRAEVQRCNNESDLRQYIQRAQEDHRRSMALWEAYN